MMMVMMMMRTANLKKKTLCYKIVNYNVCARVLICSFIKAKHSVQYQYTMNKSALGYLLSILTLPRRNCVVFFYVWQKKI